MIKNIQPNKNNFMEIKDLLKVRYKVIADYPGGAYRVGDMVQPHAYYGFDIFPYPDKYPHLFKKLEWFEERRPEDMPEYVKSLYGPEVYRVAVYDLDMVNRWCPDPIDQKFRELKYVIPATKEEYEAYSTKAKQ